MLFQDTTTPPMRKCGAGQRSETQLNVFKIVSWTNRFFGSRELTLLGVLRGREGKSNTCLKARDHMQKVEVLDLVHRAWAPCWRWPGSHESAHSLLMYIQIITEW